MGKVTLIGNIDYIAGNLRCAHYETVVDELFVQNSTKEQLKEYLRNNGELIIDDFDLNDGANIMNVEVQKL